MAISGITPKDDRKEKMDFTQAYYDSSSGAKHGFLIRVADADKFKSTDDFNQAGIKIAAQNASIQQTTISSQYTNAEMVTVAQLSDAVMEVLSGKVDALATAWDPGEGFVSTYPDELCMSSVELDIPTLGTAIAVTKGESDLLEALDAIVAHVKAEGLYEQWIDEAKALADSQESSSN